MNLFYLNIDGYVVGPMQPSQVFAYKVYQSTPVATSPEGPWAPLFTYPLLMSMLNARTNPRAASFSTSGKDKTVAGILAIILGGLGIQYFYCGKVGGGILTILLTLVTCGLWEIITLIQGIMMLIMSQEEFDAKYVYSTSTLPLF